MRVNFSHKRAAWLPWILLLAGVCTYVGFEPHASHVTLAYFPTADAWWEAEEDLYEPGITGYLYLPQSVYLFTPFLALPEGAPREIAWRIFGIVLLAFGVRRVSRRTRLEGGEAHFLHASFLALITIISSARNGQTNLHLAAVMLHACADLSDRRWGRAAFWLCAGLLAKPLGVVMLLLAGALYAPMRWRLGVGVLAFAALPFAHAEWGYVVRQYGLGFEKLAQTGIPGDKPYADLVGLLRTASIDLPQAVRTGLQVLAALATLSVCWIARRRAGRIEAAWLIGAFAACYLMLFNPRTEPNSYVLAGVFAAGLGAAAIVCGDRRGAIMIACLCVGFGIDAVPGRPIYEATRGWLQPLCALVFTALLVLRVRALPRRPLFGADGSPEREIP